MSTILEGVALDLIAVEGEKPLIYKRYPDGCYAVVRSNRRGPCAHDKPTALARWLKSGFIKFVGTGA